MDSCKLCGSAITGQYYRVGSIMSCVPSGVRISEEANRDPTPYILKGVLFAFLAACAGCLLRAIFEGILLSIGAGFVGMFLRWFLFVAIATLIVKGAKRGSSGRGGIVLQVCSALFFYLAVTLAFLPIILFNNRGLPRGLATVWAIGILCLKLPILSIPRNLMNATGLVAIFLCMGMVWTGTAAPSNPVDGPFEAVLSENDKILRRT